MYNSDIPKRAELPSSAQLIKSTIIAFIAAIVLLITIVLPSEYAIDPTGVGKILNLTEMGEIRQQLAEEAEADRQMELQKSNANEQISAAPIEPIMPVAPVSPVISAPTTVIETLTEATPEQATEELSAVEPTPDVIAIEPIWTDEYSRTLTPGEGIELKLVVAEGEQVVFRWVANGGVLNYDMHGDGSGQKISYEQGRAVPSQAGILTAEFTGNHGWFWRNRDSQDVTVTLQVRGAYSDMVLPK